MHVRHFDQSEAIDGYARPYTCVSPSRFFYQKALDMVELIAFYCMSVPGFRLFRPLPLDIARFSLRLAAHNFLSISPLSPQGTRVQIKLWSCRYQ